MLISCLIYSSTLKTEATCSYENSVDFQRTTRRYIQEDGTFRNHRCQNLKSHYEFYTDTITFAQRSRFKFPLVTILTRRGINAAAA
jgi:hypothetical protein